MALYTETRIYPPARSLALLVVKHLRSLPRDYQRTLGDEVRRDAIKIVLLVRRANKAYGPAKVPIIEELLEHLETLKLNLSFAVDLQLISKGQHGEFNHLTEEVGAQAGGWKKWAVGAPAT